MALDLDLLVEDLLMSLKEEMDLRMYLFFIFFINSII